MNGDKEENLREMRLERETNLVLELDRLVNSKKGKFLARKLLERLPSNYFSNASRE